MIKWRDRDRGIAQRAFERMLELLDLTLTGKRTPSERKEIARAREILVATCLGPLPGTDPEWVSLDRYFLHFAQLARRRESQSFQP
jgi:hypothetical protein